MYDIPSNTMYSFLSNPMFDESDFSSLPVSMLGQEIDDFMKGKGSHVYPETDALKFYFLSHVFHVMRSKFNALERLDSTVEDLANAHITVTNKIAKRLFFYSTIIAVEEARFIPAQDQNFFNFINGAYGEEFEEYVKERFPGKLTDFKKLDMTCGEYTAGMISVFAFGKWQPGFGGKGWVPIASLVADCVKGKISFEQMADQSFSLCHNNGSMFNKGHMYNCYSQFIYEILDIQDSGQIPQWVGNNLKSQYVDKELQDLYAKALKLFPEEMGGKVDNTLIRNSSEKRRKKEAAAAKQQAAAWNNWQQQAQQTQQKAAPDQKLNKILLGKLGI